MKNDITLPVSVGYSAEVEKIKKESKKERRSLAPFIKNRRSPQKNVLTQKAKIQRTFRNSK